MGVPLVEDPPNKDVALSLVLPCYNEAAGISATVDRAVDVLGDLATSFEIIVVDDGSTDGSAAVLSELGRRVATLRTISLRVNVGQQTATVIGLRAARGDLVVVSDADEHVPLNQIRVLHAAAQADPKVEVVSGARTCRNVSGFRSLGSRFVTLLVNRITGNRLTDPATSFRLFRRSAVNDLLRADILAQNVPILVGYLGLRVVEVPVETQATHGRRSRYNTVRLVHVLLLALLNFSSGTKTILSLMLLGIISTVAGGLGLGMLVLNGMIAQQELPTNLLLFFILVLVLGMQFVLVGAVAYKVERINVNLHFRRQLEMARHGHED